MPIMMLVYWNVRMILSRDINTNNAKPPFQYSLDKHEQSERNRVIQANIIEFDNKRTWVGSTLLARRWSRHSFYTSYEGLIIRSSYMVDIYLMGSLLWLGKWGPLLRYLEFELDKYTYRSIKNCSANCAIGGCHQRSTMFTIVPFFVE